MVVAISVLLAAKPDVQKLSLTSSGRERTYWLYVPEAKDAAPRPLLLLLHGSTRNGETLVRPWKDV
ncbi:MAG TPA: hypothetical protein VIZ69_01120, partial [Thermoanaerobaculia bacterium]